MQLNEDKPYDDINITPMLDLAYVLLVIFILMTTASVQGMKVNLPNSLNKTPTLARPKTKSITVNSEGRFFLDATPMASISDLETKLQALKSANPQMSVILRGDRQTQYQGIMDVLDVCGKLGLTDIGLVTKTKK
jgi:biopolymer transport protein ExbD